MPKKHIVKKGDHAARIAAENGFRDFHTIWEDAGNAMLRERRTNPHILFPGDEVIIPDPDKKEVDVAVQQKHRFETVTSALKLRLDFLDYHQKPVEGMPVDLQIEGLKVTLTTGGDGLIEVKVDPEAEIGTARVLGIEFALRIGHLDPVDEESGLAARLTNLGYETPEDAERDEDEVRSSIEEFQVDQKLKVTGELDGETKAKLLSIHGC